MLDEETKKALGVEELPKGPLRWTEKDGFSLVGRGRTEEELKKEEERKARKGKANEATKEEAQTPTSVPTEPSPSLTTPATTTASTAPLAVPIAATAAAESEVLASEPNAVHVQDANVTSDSEDDDTTIWETARENPGVPVKALAAELEGTTL